MALRQEPVAANILAMSKVFILFLPINQDPGDKFREVFLKTFRRERDVTEEITGTSQANLNSGFLLVETERVFTKSELEELRGKYRVVAVVIANSSHFTAFVHTERDKDFSKLFQEIGRKKPD